MRGRSLGVFDFRAGFFLSFFPHGILLVLCIRHRPDHEMVEADCSYSAFECIAVGRCDVQRSHLLLIQDSKIPVVTFELFLFYSGFVGLSTISTSYPEYIFFSLKIFISFLPEHLLDPWIYTSHMI